MRRRLFGLNRRVLAGFCASVCVAVVASALLMCGLALASDAATQEPKNHVRKAVRGGSNSAPTVDEASAFLADAEARLLDVGVKASHANWVQENFITEDTELLAADANQNLNCAERRSGEESEEV